jgi:hypothetical protein
VGTLRFEEKTQRVREANIAETIYTMVIGSPSFGWVRGEVQDKLGELFTKQYLEEELYPTYALKDQNAIHAMVCCFPVPGDEAIVELPDGSISFQQHVHIEWSDGTQNDFEMPHVYHFDEEGKMSETDEKGKTTFRRKA